MNVRRCYGFRINWQSPSWTERDITKEKKKRRQTDVNRLKGENLRKKAS